MNKTIIICATALLGFAAFAQGRQGMGRRMRENPDAKLHRFSTTVEKERPQLNDETKRLIAAYHRNPTDENRAALRKQCAINYDNIVKRKRAKLEELKRTFARAPLLGHPLRGQPTAGGYVGVGLPEDAKRLSREAYPPTVGRCRRRSLEWCRKMFHRISLFKSPNRYAYQCARATAQVCFR